MWMTRATRDLTKWLAVPIVGTTFSGHPTKTTLGNTFRSLLYMYYYLIVCGVKTPWNSKQCFVWASGDDVVCWISSSLASTLKNTIMALSTRKKTDDKPTGLGQCIEEVKLASWDQFEFCSKIAYSIDSQCSTLYMYRDYNKTLYHKQYYTGNNDLIHKMPAIHWQAILDGVVAEKASRALEDILKIRIFKHRKAFLSNEDLAREAQKLHDRYKMLYLQNDEHSYEHEHLINRKYGLDFAEVYKTYMEL